MTSWSSGSPKAVVDHSTTCDTVTRFALFTSVLARHFALVKKEYLYSIPPMYLSK